MPHPKRLVAVGKESLTVEEWSARTGVPAGTIRSRIDQLGWPPEKAVNTPADKRFKKGGRPRADAPRPCPPLRELADGRAVCEWRHRGVKFFRTFGRWGSPEAKADYARFVVAWATDGPGGAGPVPAGGASVALLLERWIDHCEREYRKRDKITSEVHCCRAAARHLNALYGDTPAKEFGPPEFKRVRQAMVATGWARRTVNRHCQRVIRCFKWGAGERLVPADLYPTLSAVGGLRKGRGVADPPRRKPAGESPVAAVLAWLDATGKPRPAVLAALVRVQRRTGSRPGEICALTAGQIDPAADAEVWRWDIAGDKNEHLDRGDKVAFFGRRSQAILTPLLAEAGDGPVFRWPARGKAGGKGTPVTVTAYRKELAAECRKAGVPEFTPHQLRHALATEVARRYASLDHAAAAIGDTAATAGAVYVHVDPREKLKIDIAREMG